MTEHWILWDAGFHSSTNAGFNPVYNIVMKNWILTHLTKKIMIIMNDSQLGLIMFYYWDISPLGNDFLLPQVLDSWSMVKIVG